MTETIRNFIDGTWADAGAGRRFTSHNPADVRQPVVEAPLSSREDVDRAVAAARAALPAWRSLPPPRRGEILYRAGALLIAHKQRLGELVTREMGKVIAEGLGDVQEAIDIAFYMAGEGRRFQGETVPSELPDKDCKSIREPLGVVALITPWNFPIAIPAWKLFGSLICGNTVILKPSSETPACATACPTAITYGSRDEMLKEASRRIAAKPERYYKTIYGKEEAGGTGVLYLTQQPLDELGFKKITKRPLPSYTWQALRLVPGIFLTVGGTLSAISWFQHRKDRIRKEEEGMQEKDK